MPSKPLTPQEFEDRYLSRPAEQPKAEKEATAERNDIRQALSKRTDIIKLFEPSEGVEKRVQEYYDSAFDKAFKDICSEVEPGAAEFGKARLAAVKRFRSQDIYWGSIKEMDGKGVVSIAVEVTQHAPPNVRETELYVRGIIAIDKLGYLQHRTHSGQMNARIALEPNPVVALYSEPLSWELAAINLAGGIGRLQFLDQESNSNKVTDLKMFLQELTAAEIQINLADHLSKGNFSAQIRRNLQSRHGAHNPEQFISKMRVNEWSSALTGFSFSGMGPSVGKGEELARAWLCRMAALRHFAHKQAGFTADSQTKFNQFAELYLDYSPKFKVNIW